MLDSARRVTYANPAAENLFELSRRSISSGHTPRADLRRRRGPRRGDRQGGARRRDLHRAGARARASPASRSCTSPARCRRSTRRDAALLLEFRHIDQQLKIAREERLNEQQQANRELIRNLAHEIKNPLGGIRGAAQLLERELDRPQLIEYTQVIIGEADRLQSLVNRLLTPHRLPTYRRTNIHEIARARAQRRAGGVSARSTIVCDFDISLPEFDADPEQLTQAVLNIVRNAAQALDGDDGRSADPPDHARRALRDAREEAPPARAGAVDRGQRPGHSRRRSATGSSIRWSPGARAAAGSG